MSNHTENAHHQQILASDTNIDIWNLTFTCFITTTATIGNVAIFAAFCFDRKVRHKPNDWILFVISCLDLTVALVVVPIEIVNVIGGGLWVLGESLCYIHVFLGYTLLTAGNYLMVLLSWDSCSLVSKEFFDYLKDQNTARVVKLINVALLLSTFPGLLEIGLWKYLTPASDHFHCIVPSSYYPLFSAVMVTTYSLIPILIVITCCVIFLICIHRKLRRVQPASPNLRVATLSNTSDALTLPKWPHQMMQLDRIPRIVNKRTKSNEEDAQKPSTSGSEANAESTSTDNSSPRISQRPDVVPPSIIVVSPAQDPQESQQELTDKLVSQRYIKPALIYCALVICLFTCSTPLAIYSINTSIFCQECFNARTFLNLIFFAYFKSSLNPIVSSLVNCRIRRFYKRQFHKIVRMICR